MQKWALIFACLGLASTPVLAQTSQTYVYDVHGRLTGTAVVPGGAGASLSGYAYDSADNRGLRRGETRALLAAVDTLASGEQLVLGQRLTSTDGRFRFEVQPDGHLVVWNGGSALWASYTFGSQALQLVMQGDGNLVLYGPNYAVIWSSGTGSAGARLVMQNDGNLVIYSGYTAVWSTGTGGH